MRGRWAVKQVSPLAPRGCFYTLRKPAVNIGPKAFPMTTQFCCCFWFTTAEDLDLPVMLTTVHSTEGLKATRLVIPSLPAAFLTVLKGQFPELGISYPGRISPVAPGSYRGS